MRADQIQSSPRQILVTSRLQRRTANLAASHEFTPPSMIASPSTQNLDGRSVMEALPTVRSLFRGAEKGAWRSHAVETFESTKPSCTDLFR
jgi:hypothetical protein